MRRPCVAKLSVLVLLTHLCAGCSFSVTWFRQALADRAVANQDYPRALEIWQKIIADDPDSSAALKAAVAGAKVAHLEVKNYALAVEFYRHVVLTSHDSEERRSAERQIAQIDFENLQDYSQAVLEYEKLLKLDNSSEDAFHFRLNLAKSQLHMNNIDQALSEIDNLLAQANKPDMVFEARVLKANTLVAAKRMSEAIVLWESVLKDFPEKSKKENVALNLVVCYEETKEFGKAIEVLETMRAGYPDPAFLNLRIQRLRERKDNMPGAQGLRR